MDPLKLAAGECSLRSYEAAQIPTADATAERLVQPAEATDASRPQTKGSDPRQQLHKVGLVLRFWTGLAGKLKPLSSTLSPTHERAPGAAKSRDGRSQ